MANFQTEKDFILSLDSKGKLIVYLSVSWQPGKGKDFGYKVIKKLDNDGIVAVGDTKGFDTMDEKRVKRIMSQTDCFISILPFRPDNASKTSIFLLDELRIALELNIPIIILVDSRVPFTNILDEHKRIITFADNRRFNIPSEKIVYLNSYDFGVDKSEDIELILFSDSISRSTFKKIQPYSFLICRLQPDFNLPRLACKTAAEAATGIPCIWIDSNDYKTNIDDTVERARLLIKNAEFVIGEISIADENVYADNPSRAHEIGLATAYQKNIFLVSHSPRRNLYHGLVSRQLLWWDDEKTLFKDLKDQIYNERGAFGRHIYNYELNNLEQNSSKFAEPIFDTNGFPFWSPPFYEETEKTQSWIYAISFGVIVGCSASLIKKVSGYDQTYDIIAIFTGLITFFFSSRINKHIQKILLRVSYLKWLIPLIALVLFFLSFVYVPSHPI